MTNKIRNIKLLEIMDREKCTLEKAERFLELSEMLESEDFTPEVGKQAYKELENLRREG